MDPILVSSYIPDQPDFSSEFQSPQSNQFDGSPNQGSPYESFDYPQDSAHFPHTPSYNGSYQNSPYSNYSDLPPFDGPDDNNLGLFPESHPSAVNIPEYDPVDFDVPTSTGLLLDDGFMSGLPGHPHISVTSFDPKPSSPGLFDHSSPASSNGAEDDSRSRASSSSSYVHPNSPHMDFAQNFESMRFDSPNWASGPLPPIDRSSPPALKPPSPPQLVIPDSSTSPSVTGMDSPPIINAPDGDGGMPTGPQLHIVPATPVSGGAGAAQSVPFQATLANLHTGGSQGVQPPDVASWNRQSQMQLVSSAQNARLDSSQFADQSFTYPGSDNNHEVSTSGMAYGSETPLSHPAGQGQSHQFLFPQGMQRSRSLSDTSLRPPAWDTPMMNPLGHQGSSVGADGNRLGSHDARRPGTTVNMNDVLPGPSSSPLLSGTLSPSQTQLRHPSSAGPHTVTFGMQPSPLLQPFAFQDFLTPESATCLRRAKSDSIRTHRQVRSEDLRYIHSNPGAPGLSGMASANGMRYPPPSSSQQDFILATRQFLHPAAAAAEPVASITRGSHQRRASSGSRERSPGMGGWSSGASSARASPYPSPSVSPRPGYGALPPADMSMPSMQRMDGGMLGMAPGLGNGAPAEVPMTVSKVNVTTPSTADASQKRRKQPANFACPVPGCGSTFTRHFNLKGHLRSHAEEKPFMCKWPGCGKGFARQHDCKRHEQLHLNIRPYPCEGCKKNFARMDALNRHLRSEGGAECRKIQDEITPASLAAENMQDMSIQAQSNLKPEPDSGWPMGGVMM